MDTQYSYCDFNKYYLGERPYNCEYCEHKFSSKDGLADHTRRLHTTYRSNTRAYSEIRMVEGWSKPRIPPPIFLCIIFNEISLHITYIYISSVNTKHLSSFADPEPFYFSHPDPAYKKPAKNHRKISILKKFNYFYTINLQQIFFRLN